MLNYDKAPENMRGGLQRFIENGILPGNALTAVLENDLKRTIAHADETTLANLRSLVQWIYCEAPGSCWGSPQLVREWAEKRGMDGITASQKNQVEPKVGDHITVTNAGADGTETFGDYIDGDTAVIREIGTFAHGRVWYDVSWTSNLVGKNEGTRNVTLFRDEFEVIP